MNDTMEERIARFRLEVQTVSNQLVADLQEAQREDLKARGLTSTPDQLRDDAFKCGKAHGQADYDIELIDFLKRSSKAAADHGNVYGVRPPSCTSQSVAKGVLELHNASYEKGLQVGFKRGFEQGRNEGRKESLEYDIDRIMDSLNQYIKGCIRVANNEVGGVVWPDVLAKYPSTPLLINELWKATETSGQRAPVSQAPDHTRTPAGMIVQALRLLLEELKQEGK